MVWSPKCAANAYLDTVKLVKNELERKKSDPGLMALPSDKNELISALAAGTSAQLIVEVSPESSNSTIALAAAARQTGGRLVCILPEEDSLESSQRAIEECGLNDMVEFQVGDPVDILPKYEKIDFSLVDCNHEGYKELLRLIDVNPHKSVVVANNLKGGNVGLMTEDKLRTEKHMVGDRMEVTMIGRNVSIGDWRGTKRAGEKRHNPRRRSRWIKRIDEESGEEHIYRLATSV